MDRGERQFNWWIARAVIALVLLCLFCKSRPAPLPSNVPIRTTNRR